MLEPASLLNAFVTSLEAPYGKEYSVRWRQGFAEHDRFLMSIHKLAIADSANGARQKLESFLQQLGCPLEASRQLWEYWSNTCVVHFGYEHPSSGPPCLKVYFELAAKDQVDVRNEQLIHIAVKWSPLAPENTVLSRYSLVPCLNASKLYEHLGLLCPDHFLPAFEGLISKALRRCDASDVMLLAITDDNSPRRSCDLNLYNGHLTIGESISELRELAALNHCQQDNLLTSKESLQLGHLAAGRDRNRNDFVTVYYGVESH